MEEGGGRRWEESGGGDEGYDGSEEGWVGGWVGGGLEVDWRWDGGLLTMLSTYALHAARSSLTSLCSPSAIVGEGGVAGEGGSCLACARSRSHAGLRTDADALAVPS